MDPYINSKSNKICHDNPVFQSDQEINQFNNNNKTKIIINSIQKNINEEVIHMNQVINDCSNLDQSQIKNTTLLYISNDNCNNNNNNNHNVEMEGVETITNIAANINNNNNYYNSCDKLAAAAAAAVSSSSLVEIPNFGDGLIMDQHQNRMVRI